MRRTFKIAAALCAAAIALAMTGCTEYSCEFCGQSFSSGGSVSVTSDGREIPLCSYCMSRLKNYITNDNSD